jgi:uncharacterized protein (DUF169 family)
MRPLQSDLSIYKKFNFKHSPAAVKFCLPKPEGIEQLDKSIPFCEMLREVRRRGTPFYFSRENENCIGKIVLGMEDFPLFVEGGLIGPRFGIFQEPRANNKIYQYIPRFRPGLVNYVVFAPLDKLTFEPDLLVFTATPSQAEILLRAMSYSTGELWETRTTGVLGCTWLYIYPFQSGKVNYTVTGLAFGTKSKEIFEEGWMLVSIPYNWLPIITANLNEMEWVLPSYTDGREKFMKREEKIFKAADKEAKSA